jgi:acetyl esterase
VYLTSEVIKSPLPALVFFHGGGGVLGSIETHDSIARRLAAESRAVIISVDYRLAPEDRFPAAVEDAWVAFEWVVEHATALGLDPRAIAVGGDGFGGTLAAVVCLIGRDADRACPALQLLLYPTLAAVGRVTKDVGSSTQSRGDIDWTGEIGGWAAQYYLGDHADQADWRVVPSKAQRLRDLPPALIVTARPDPFGGEAVRYAARLRTAGVAVRHLDYDGVVHGFLSMAGVVSEAHRALSTIGDWLFEALIKR